MALLLSSEAPSFTVLSIFLQEGNSCPGKRQMLLAPTHSCQGPVQRRIFLRTALKLGFLHIGRGEKLTLCCL